MTLFVLAVASLACGLIPCGTFLRNLSAFRRAPRSAPVPPEAISVLIPARNEAANIGDCLAAILPTLPAAAEILVGDDGSTDATPEIVRAIAARDPRVCLVSVPPLPPGWCGKQHACHTVAARAAGDLLLFLDADVRLLPHAPARLAAAMASHVGLISAFPRQVTVTFLERLLLPLIHFVLLGFLPLRRMQSSAHPAYAAGCGQLFLARAAAYRAAGGHAAVRASLHDGVTLPRAFRTAGFSTDVMDGTDLATCRMYHSSAATWQGLAKNATEGLATPTLIVPITVLLLLGQVIPFPLLILAIARRASYLTIFLVAGATAAAYLPRLVAAFRFRQSVLGALLHPLGIFSLLAIQWHAFSRHLARRPSTWRGRAYAPENPSTRMADLKSF